MIKKSNFYSALLSMLLGISLLFGAASNGFAGEPPPDSRITGKAIDAVLSAVIIRIENFEIVVQTIVGTCNNVPFAIGPEVNNPITPELFGGILEEQVEGIYLENAGPAGCYSALGGENLVITRVSNFSNTGDAIGAEISLRIVE